MSSIFGILNRKKKFDEPFEPEIQMERKSLDLTSIVESNRKEKTMNADELHTPNQQDVSGGQKEIHTPNQMSIDASPQNIPPIGMQFSEKNIGSMNVPMKTFDILAIEMDADGRPKQKQISGVKATSAEELRQLYAVTGTRIQILKEYGGPSEQQMPEHRQQPQQYAPQMVQHQPLRQKEPPKFFEIGGVKCKLEDGKMFQEQWVRVDAAKYRLVADTTNKLVSMNGKHLEMLKWIQIEDEGDTENA